MKDDSTSSESITTVPRRNGQRIVSGGSVSGDAYAPAIVTAGTRSTGATRLQPIRRMRSRSQSRELVPRVKHACSAFFGTCLDNLDRALDHHGDFILRSNAIEQVKDTLSELWRVRSHREEQFGEVINMLQAVFAGRTIVDFTTDKIHCLRSVFSRLHENSFVDDDMANEITVELLNGGIDVFRELE